MSILTNPTISIEEKQTEELVRTFIEKQTNPGSPSLQGEALSSAPLKASNSFLIRPKTEIAKNQIHSLANELKEEFESVFQGMKIGGKWNGPCAYAIPETRRFDFETFLQKNGIPREEVDLVPFMMEVPRIRKARRIEEQVKEDREKSAQLEIKKQEEQYTLDQLLEKGEIEAAEYRRAISELDEQYRSQIKDLQNKSDRNETAAVKIAIGGKKLRFEPQPLQREVEPPRSFPFETLGSHLGPVARRIFEIVKAPDSVCGQAVLAAASFLVQPHADVCIDGRSYPISLFMLTVAESGDRKSAVDNIVLKPIRDYEKMLKKVSEEELRVFKNKRDVWKKRRDQLMADCKIDCLERELNNLDPEPKGPLSPHLLLEEPTYEGLVKLFAVGQPSVGLFSDEGGRMFGGHSMGKDNLLKTACGLSSLWDGKPITRIRGGDDNLLLHGRRFSLHLMIQEVVLSAILGNETLLGQGMMARCLVVSPPTNSGNRPYNPVDYSKDSIILEFWKRSTEILDRPFPLADPEIKNELSPRLLAPCNEAKEAWVNFHNEIDLSLRADGLYYAIRRTANKAAEQALRIAGVLALIEDLNANSISLDVMSRAIILMRFYLDEALRLVEVVGSNSELALAQAVLDWMKKRTGKVFSLREIYQRGGPRGVRNRDAAKKILQILEDHSQVRRPIAEKDEWILT